MSFQAYLDSIKEKTGHTPAELKELAEEAGIYSPDMLFNSLKLWLHEEYGLGHGHCLAVWAVWKNKGWVKAPK